MFDSVAGVEPQSETVWRQADKYRVPRICFVNKMDRIGADFKRTFDQIISKLEANPVAIQLPIGSEDKFVGVIDIIKMKSITYKDETMGADYVIGDIPDDMMEEAKHYREQLIEKVSEADDKILESWPQGRGAEEEIKAAIAPGQQLGAGQERSGVRAGDLRFSPSRTKAQAAARRRGRPRRRRSTCWPSVGSTRTRRPTPTIPTPTSSSVRQLTMRRSAPWRSRS